MSIFKKRLSRKTKIQIGIAIAAILLLILYLVLDLTVFKGPFSKILSDKDAITDFVRSWGIFGPLAFILLQIVQTVAAPIPGTISGTVGGYLFGWWGILWTTIGSAIGFLIVFIISRRFGRGLVEKVVKKKYLEKFDYLAEENGSFVFFLIFLIPGLPDDIVGYIAGLTQIPIKNLLIMVIVGRMPSVIMTNMFGAGLGEDKIYPVVIIAAISAIILVIIALKRDAIMKYINKPTSKNDEQ